MAKWKLVKLTGQDNFLDFYINGYISQLSDPDKAIDDILNYSYAKYSNKYRLGRVLAPEHYNVNNHTVTAFGSTYHLTEIPNSP